MTCRHTSFQALQTWALNWTRPWLRMNAVHSSAHHSPLCPSGDPLVSFSTGDLVQTLHSDLFSMRCRAEPLSRGSVEDNFQSFPSVFTCCQHGRYSPAHHCGSTMADFRGFHSGMFSLHALDVPIFGNVCSCWSYRYSDLCPGSFSHRES